MKHENSDSKNQANNFHKNRLNRTTVMKKTKTNATKKKHLKSEMPVILPTATVKMIDHRRVFQTQAKG